jgi:nicotinate-nucleotide pyrophosphorylase
MSVATFASLDPVSYREVVRRALAEDVRWGAITTEAVVPTGSQTAGALVLGTRCVLAGPVSVDRMAQAADVGAEYASLDVWIHAAPRVQVALELKCARG